MARSEFLSLGLERLSIERKGVRASRVSAVRKFSRVF